jgi:hypothetical protein
MEASMTQIVKCGCGKELDVDANKPEDQAEVLKQHGWRILEAKPLIALCRGCATATWDVKQIQQELHNDGKL